MATYVFAYRSPKGCAPGPETNAPWTAWFESMGRALVDIGKPAFKRCALGRCGAEETELGGYSFVTADNLEVAVASQRGAQCLASTAASRSASSPTRRPGRRQVSELTTPATDSERPGRWR
jgi:hypothetical protein